MKVVLTMVDFTGPQNFIFKSNRLRECIGASHLVAEAAKSWVPEILNLSFDSAGIELENVDAEIIYLGGGNALILFKAAGDDGKAKARDFAHRFSLKLLTDAPGLEAVISHSLPFDFTENSPRPVIIDRLNEIIRDIRKKKACRKISSPLNGMGVSVQCVSTGGIAVKNPIELGKNDKQREVLADKYKGNYVSQEIIAKLSASEQANKRLKETLFGKIKHNPKIVTLLEARIHDVDWSRLADEFLLDVPYEFDNLGRTEGEASFIAVVHTDGNAMGKRIQALGEEADRVKTNRDWINEMRGMSESIENANLEALQFMTALLLLNLDQAKRKVVSPNGEEIILKERYSFEKDETVYCLPFRPIIFGGEDVAFICDGRIALALTSFYLMALEQKTLLRDEKPLYGRAGVAIVKSHYPFRRAYALSEQLAKSAKDRIKEIEVDKSEAEKGTASALDWHLAFTGLAGDIGEIRRREYRSKQGKLNMRPLSLNQPNQWRDWGSFVSILSEFQNGWQEKRNKAKRLRDALRGGEERVKEFIQLYKQPDMPRVPLCQRIETTGWDRSATERDREETLPRCGYFDALEMMDLYFPLDQSKLDIG